MFKVMALMGFLYLFNDPAGTKLKDAQDSDNTVEIAWRRSRDTTDGQGYLELTRNNRGRMDVDAEGFYFTIKFGEEGANARLKGNDGSLLGIKYEGGNVIFSDDVYIQYSPDSYYSILISNKIAYYYADDTIVGYEDYEDNRIKKIIIGREGTVDSIRGVVLPEPSAIALILLGGGIFFFLNRRFKWTT